MIRIRRAEPADLPEVLALLARSALPVEGVEEHFSHFLVATRDGQIIACGGFEIEEGCALLRSVAVADDARGERVGIEIVRQALRLASAARAETAYLYTTSASGFFSKLGFTPALSAEVEGAFPNSSETRPGGCCSTATAMVLRDLSATLEPR
jgi:amino-acid N-acetyltransferase